MTTLYLIRNRDTGLYWRAPKKRYGQVQRTAWTDSPAKAWHCWQKGSVEGLFKGHFWAADLPNYEVVEFQMVEGRA